MALVLVGGIRDFAASSADTSGTCGLDHTEDPDCAKHDFGSCGNACCAVRVTFNAPGSEVASALSVEIAKGGRDKAFTPARTWGDFFSLDAGGCRDLRAASETDDQFLCQAMHRTAGHYKFQDTINILVAATGAKGTPVSFFSISNIAGALGDAGQNYKNIQLLLEALAARGLATTSMHVTLGCGSTSQQTPSKASGQATLTGH